MKLLLQDNRVNPSDDFNCAIRWASQTGRIEIVKLLLQDNRVNPADNSNSAIRWASRYGHIKIVKLLLQDNGVNPADNSNCAIRWASEKGHIEIVKLLIPYIDISTITDEKIINLAQEIIKTKKISEDNKVENNETKKKN